MSINFLLDRRASLDISIVSPFTETMKTAKKQKEEPLEAGPRIARKLDLDPATIRRWAREGAPHHVLGDKLVRYRLSELLAWRAAR